MKPIRFLLVGGFLGSGKTTTIGRLAEQYQAQGLKVGIVTNDQAADLVDTHALRSQGYSVGEVAGACFCCNFNELVGVVEGLENSNRPDVILAEPVGSCTDLVATVARPLARLYGGRFEVAPYAVILKPSHGLRILKPGKLSGFSPKAAYIFRKQLEEADCILINRIDELEPAQVEELSQLVAKGFPGTPQLRISAKTGDGFAPLVELLSQQGNFGKSTLELDYEIYAEGEAELGWLNSQFAVEFDRPTDLDALLVDIVSRLHERMEGLSAETAHLKVIGWAGSSFGVANLVSSESPVELSIPSKMKTIRASVIVNARVALDPEMLAGEVLGAISASADHLRGRIELGETRSFRPGRPVPTHRLAAAEA